MSASDCVAKTTETFLLRSVLSHSRRRRGKERRVEEDPGFVEHEQRRAAVEAVFEPMKEIGQHRQHGRARVHQLLGLECLNVVVP